MTELEKDREFAKTLASLAKVIIGYCPIRPEKIPQQSEFTLPPLRHEKPPGKNPCNEIVLETSEECRLKGP